jgi:hypothetical protein
MAAFANYFFKGKWLSNFHCNTTLNSLKALLFGHLRVDYYCVGLPCFGQSLATETFYIGKVEGVFFMLALEFTHLVNL